MFPNKIQIHATSGENKNLRPGDAFKRFAQVLTEKRERIGEIHGAFRAKSFLQNCSSRPSDFAGDPLLDLVVCSPPYPKRFQLPPYHIHEWSGWEWISQSSRTGDWKPPKIQQQRKERKQPSRLSETKLKTIFSWLKEVNPSRRACLLCCRQFNHPRTGTRIMQKY